MHQQTSHSKTFSSTCLETFPAEAAGVTAELRPLYQSLNFIWFPVVS